MGVTNHLLTGMILQVGAHLVLTIQESIESRAVFFRGSSYVGAYELVSVSDVTWTMKSTDPPFCCLLGICWGSATYPVMWGINYKKNKHMKFQDPGTLTNQVECLRVGNYRGFIIRGWDTTQLL